MPKASTLGTLVAAIIAGSAGFYLSIRWQETSSLQGQAQQIADQYTQENQILPSFSMPDLAGVQRNSEEWNGRLRLINFWATWCAPCRKEMPALNALYSDPQNPLIVIGIAVDKQTSVESFLKEYPVDYPILIGEKKGMQLGQQWGNRLGVLPYSLLVDENDKIVEVIAGEIAFNELKRRVQSLRDKAI